MKPGIYTNAHGGRIYIAEPQALFNEALAAGDHEFAAFLAMGGPK